MEKVLPKGWVETELGSFAYLKNGYAYKTTQFKDSGIPILKISNITKDGKVDISNPQYVDESLINEAFLVKSGDIVIAMSGATTGKFGVYNSNDLLLQNQRVGNIKLRNESLGSKKLLYYLIASLRKEIEDRAYGGAQPNISPTLIETIQILLPPLAEQERIVAKLDKLFAQHEKIKKALERIPQLLKDFRQQVLTQAVSGKLTESWRRGKNLGDWQERLMKNITTKLGSGSTPRGGSTTYLSEGIPLVRSMNIVFGGIKSDGLAFINDVQATALKSVEIQFEDILLNITGASIGRLCLADKTVTGGRVNQHVFIIRSNREIVYPKFLECCLRSNIVQSFIEEIKYGAGMEAISKTQIENLKINVPTLQEQQEIVCRVESLFAKADLIESHYQTLKAKVDALPQAILHKAFKGELVPQLPTDGDANDLLAEIVRLKGEVKPKIARKKHRVE